MLTSEHKNPQRTTWFRAMLPFFLVLAMGVVSVASILFIQNRNRWSKHTDEVLQQIISIEKLVIDMETGQRGFLLTGREHFLEPYNIANNKLENMLSYLENLVSDNPSQVERAREIMAIKMTL